MSFYFNFPHFLIKNLNRICDSECYVVVSQKHDIYLSMCLSNNTYVYSICQVNITRCNKYSLSTYLNYKIFFSLCFSYFFHKFLLKFDFYHMSRQEERKLLQRIADSFSIINYISFIDTEIEFCVLEIRKRFSNSVFCSNKFIY